MYENRILKSIEVFEKIFDREPTFKELAKTASMRPSDLAQYLGTISCVKTTKGHSGTHYGIDRTYE